LSRRLLELHTEREALEAARGAPSRLAAEGENVKRTDREQLAATPLTARRLRLMLLVLGQLLFAPAAVSHAQGPEFEFDAPESMLRLAALGQLPSTAEIATEVGVLRNLWEGYNTRDIVDPQSTLTPDEAVSVILGRAATAGVNTFVLNGEMRSWVAWYRALAQLAQTVHPSYIAAAIVVTPSTRAACPSRTDDEVSRLGVQIGSHLQGSEVRRIFYRTATLLVSLEPAERYRVLAEVSSTLASVCENGWMID
jgi:hypothetical protein